MHRRRCKPHVDSLQPPIPSPSNDGCRRRCHARAAGQDSQGTYPRPASWRISLAQILRSIIKAETQQYFKSIERVATELGFRQKLPRKRDSFVDEGALLVPARNQANGISLTAPQQDISRSTSPMFEPMSARLDDEEAATKVMQSWDAVEDQPSVCMSARVAG